MSLHVFKCFCRLQESDDVVSKVVDSSDIKVVVEQKLDSTDVEQRVSVEELNKQVQDLMGKLSPANETSTTSSLDLFGTSEKIITTTDNSTPLSEDTKEMDITAYIAANSQSTRRGLFD